MPIRRMTERRCDTRNTRPCGIIWLTAYWILCRYRHSIHATGSTTRLDREGITDYRDLAARAQEELVAELGAAFLCAELGFGYTGVADSAAYLAHWLSALEEDTRAIFRAARDASKAVRFLMGDATVEAAAC